MHEVFLVLLTGFELESCNVKSDALAIEPPRHPHARASGVVLLLLLLLLLLLFFRKQTPENEINVLIALSAFRDK